MTELKRDSNGFVKIADDVIAMIAGKAAMEVEGVASLAGIAGYFESAPRAVIKQIMRGVTVAINEGKINITLAISVRMGAKLHEVAAEVQSRIRSVVENMTGMEVSNININVSAVVTPPKKRA